VYAEKEKFIQDGFSWCGAPRTSPHLGDRFHNNSTAFKIGQLGEEPVLLLPQLVGKAEGDSITPKHTTTHKRGQITKGIRIRENEGCWGDDKLRGGVEATMLELVKKKVGVLSNKTSGKSLYLLEKKTPKNGIQGGHFRGRSNGTLKERQFWSGVLERRGYCKTSNFGMGWGEGQVKLRPAA